MVRIRNSLVLIFSIFSILSSGRCLTINAPPSAALISPKNSPSTATDNVKNVAAQNTPSCSCGVFLSGQFVKGSPKPPVGYPAIITELEDQLTCSTLGAKQCATKCLEGLVKYLPNSAPIICGSIDRDAYKERAYLFVNNCNNGWTNTNFSAGREYCCKDGTYYKCPMVI